MMSIEWLARRRNELRDVGETKLAEALGWFISDNGIGMEPGQLREGSLGLWDLYYFLHQDCNLCSAEKAAEVVGLKIDDIRQEENASIAGNLAFRNAIFGNQN